MNYNAMELYKSFDFLECVKILMEVRRVRPSFRFIVPEKIDRQTRKENGKTRKSHKKLFRCTKYNYK